DACPSSNVSVVGVCITIEASPAERGDAGQVIMPIQEFEQTAAAVAGSDHEFEGQRGVAAEVVFRRKTRIEVGEQNAIRAASGPQNRVDHILPGTLEPIERRRTGRPIAAHTKADPRAALSQFVGTPVPLRGAAAIAGERRPAPDGRAQVEQTNVIAGIQVAGPLRIRVPTIRDYSAAARKAIPAPAGVEKKRQGLRARGY